MAFLYLTFFLKVARIVLGAWIGTYRCSKKVHLQWCLTLCDLLDCILPRLLCPWNSPGRNNGLVSISYSTGYSWPRDQTHVSCIGRQILYHRATWENLLKEDCCKNLIKIPQGKKNCNNLLELLKFCFSISFTASIPRIF